MGMSCLEQRPSALDVREDVRALLPIVVLGAMPSVMHIAFGGGSPVEMGIGAALASVSLLALAETFVATRRTVAQGDVDYRTSAAPLGAHTEEEDLS